MDWKELTMALLGIGISVVAWWVKQRDKEIERLMTRIAEVDDGFSKFRLQVVGEFVNKSDMDKAIDSLREMFSTIFKKLDKMDEKLDRKVDK